MTKRWTISKQGVLLACILLAGCREESASGWGHSPILEPDLPCGSVRLGCVTASNIAALAQRPGDFVKPRGTQWRDPARREAALAAYRDSKAASSAASSSTGVTNAGHAGN